MKKLQGFQNGPMKKILQLEHNQQDFETGDCHDNLRVNFA